jgi:hypothetical protein
VYFTTWNQRQNPNKSKFSRKQEPKTLAILRHIMLMMEKLIIGYILTKFCQLLHVFYECYSTQQSQEQLSKLSCIINNLEISSHRNMEVNYHIYIVAYEETFQTPLAILWKISRTSKYSHSIRCFNWLKKITTLKLTLKCNIISAKNVCFGNRTSFRTAIKLHQGKE